MITKYQHGHDHEQDRENDHDYEKPSLLLSKLSRMLLDRQSNLLKASISLAIFTILLWSSLSGRLENFSFGWTQ